MVINQFRNLFKKPSQEKLPLFGMLSSQSYAQPQWSNFTVSKAVQEGFKTSVWVYRCVNLIAQSMASVRFLVVDENNEPVLKHPVQSLLDMPNPEIAPKAFKMLLAQHLQLAGNAYVKKVKQGTRSIELWPMLPDKVSPVPSANLGQLLGSYQLNLGTGFDYISPELVVHLKFEDPSNPLLGISPLMAAAKEVDIAVEQSRWNKLSLQNRGNPDGIVSFDAELSRDQVTEIEQAIREKRAGADNAHKIWVFPAGAKFQKMSMSQVDLDFIEGKKLTREEICAAFGVPPPLVGIYDSATYNNVQSAERLFWEFTMVPQLEGICDSLTWGLSDELAGYRIVPDFKHVKALEESMESRVRVAQALFAMGLPLAEINRRLALNLDLSQVPTASESFVAPLRSSTLL
jgi:HK97 family phage portal protein